MLDLSTGSVGGIATMVLADFGAEVVKVEPVGGDPWRSLAAAPMWLRGKRSVELDVVDERARLEELIREADVVVSTDSPARAKARGLQYADLRALNEAAVYCSITGFGPTGPYAEYPAYEALVSAKTGRMLSFVGQRNREGPGFAAVPVGAHGASQGAVQGILAALIERQRCGQGQIVETSLLQGLMPFDLLLLLLTQLSEREPEVYPQVFNIGGGMPTLNYHPVMTRDGRWIQLGNLLEHLFYAFMDAADLTLLFAEEQWQGSQAEWTPEATEEMRDRILERMQEKTCDEWMEIFRAQGNVAAEPFTPTHDAVDNLDMAANGDTIEIEDPDLGPVKQVGPDCAPARNAGRDFPSRPGGWQCERILLALPQRRSTDDDIAQRRDTVRQTARRLHGARVRDDHRHADRRLNARRPGRTRDQSRTDRRRSVPRHGRRTAAWSAGGEDERGQGIDLHRPQGPGRPGDRRRPDRPGRRDRA